MVVVFIALIAVFFDLILFTPNGTWLQFFAGLFMMTSIVIYRKKQIRGLIFSIKKTSDGFGEELIDRKI